MICGYNRGSNSRCLKSVPQLQPEESFNVAAPFRGTPTVLDGRVCFVVCDDSESRVMSVNVMSVNYRDGSISHKPFTTKRRFFYAVASRSESIFIFGGEVYNGQSVSTCEKLDIASGNLTQLPEMLPARWNASALNIPEIGIVVVGGICQDNRQNRRLRSAEVLVEDPGNESGWRWIRLNPMLKERDRPGVAYFRGCVVVAGGRHELYDSSAEYLPLTSIEQTNAQWTRLRDVDGLNLFRTSLALFNNRLILLVSGDKRIDAYEFLPTEENQSLANFEWKPIFQRDDFDYAKLLVAREKLEEH
ncbi:unnamed protein product [Taenia asiatica]|uniref:Kelch repeat protein n=1 Tax=Taenia asiatica TaxID=60517 RepID=A0A0R3WHB4_TAEAS|nr:unnamed protein product [Taenia asiatica]